MQKTNYLIVAGLFFVAYIFFGLYFPGLEVSQLFYFFEICCIILYSVIIAMAYKANKIFPKREYIYLMVGYSLLLLLGAIAAGMRFSILSFRDYTFYLLKIFEAFIYFFAIFLFYEKENYKKIVAIFVASVFLNLVIVILLLNNYWTQHITLLLYCELLLMYRCIKKEKINYFIRSFLFKTLSELMFIGYVVQGNGLFFLFTASAYLISIFEIILYLNREIDDEIMWVESSYRDRIEKLFYLNKKGLLFVSDLYVKEFNKTALEILEVNEEKEIKNKSIMSIFDVMNEEALHSAMEKDEYEIGLPLKKNKGKFVNIRINKIANPTGNLYLFLLENEFSFENSLEVLNDSLAAFSYVYKKDVGYRYISNGFEKIFGINRDRLLENGDFLLEIVDDGQSCFLKEISKGSENFSFDQGYSVNGEDKMIRETVTRVKINSEEFFYGIGVDISDFYQKEKELVSKNQKLESENLKTEMAISVVSHEIRTPITAIIGFVENIIINNESLDEKIFGMIKKVYSNSVRLKELVDNLLDFNKLNAGKMEVFKEKVGVKGLLEEVLTNNEMLMELKNIKLKNNVEEEVYILADSSMIYQVLNNILSNSIKYNKDYGNIIIDVAEDEEHVTISVEDTGIGLKEESKANVFKEYGRAKGTREKGTGLGLSLSKRLVDINGGQIWFESEYEKGSIFYIKFQKG